MSNSSLQTSMGAASDISDSDIDFTSSNDFDCVRIDEDGSPLSGGPSSGSNGVSVTEVARVLNDRLSLSQMEVESVQSWKRARLGQGPNLGSQGENTDIEMEVVDAAHHSGGSTTTAASFRNYRLNTPTSQLSSEDGYGSDDADGSVSAQLPALGHHQHDPSTPGLPASISTMSPHFGPSGRVVAEEATATGDGTRGPGSVIFGGTPDGPPPDSEDEGMMVPQTPPELLRQIQAHRGRVDAPEPEAEPEPDVIVMGCPKCKVAFLVSRCSVLRA